MREFFRRFKPSVERRTLLLIAGVAWSIAGGILFSRGFINLIILNHLLVPELVLGAILGMVFYILMFSKISGKHIFRITSIRIDDPCFFSFFSIRSYILMAIMISGGITLRKLDIINHEIMYTFYITMGIPLLISSFRFYLSWYKNKPAG